MKRTVFPKLQETKPYSLEPFIRSQLQAKGYNGGFYDPYDPDPCLIDIFSARAAATAGMDISEGITASAFNIPAGNRYIPAVRYSITQPSGHIILFLHGGGFTVGSISHKDAQCRYLAQVSGADVISLEYRLAPEAMYPAGKEDAIAGLQYCASLDHDALIIGGDSAGAALSANAILESGVKTDFAFFLYGAFDLETAEAMEVPFSYADFPVSEEDRNLVCNRLNRFRRLAVDMHKMYLPEGISAKDPAVSPMYAEDFSAFPSSLFIIAEYDYYRFCNEAFACKLERQGIPAEVLFYEGLDHGFFDRLGSVPQAKHCIEQIGIRVKTL